MVRSLLFVAGRNTKRKAQLKMFETVGVLVVFFFLLGTGSIFYFGVQKSSLQKEKLKASEQYAFQIVLKSLYLPELDCSFLVTQRDNCIDALKMQQLSKLINESDIAIQDYFGEFGYASISVSEKYPEQTRPIVVYDNAPSEYTGKILTQSPILVYNAITDEYKFVVIEVSVYV